MKQSVVAFVEYESVLNLVRDHYCDKLIANKEFLRKRLIHDGFQDMKPLDGWIYSEIIGYAKANKLFDSILGEFPNAEYIIPCIGSNPIALIKREE